MVAVGLAPWAEESLFRGVVQPVLTLAGGPALGIVVSTGVFALLHAGDAVPPAWGLAAATVPGGLLCAWLRWRTGRLSGALGAHMGFNLVGWLAWWLIR